MKIGIVAGEASGDLLGAKLIEALRERIPDLQVEGLGGPAMIAAGCHSFFDMDRLSVMGLIEPLFRLADILKIRKRLYQHFLANRPDVFIGIDAPDFNIGLEYKLRRLGIPVVHYVSPSVWAWRQYRIRKIAKSVDLMLTLFPFEATFYEKHGVPFAYVGHPLADQIPLKSDKQTARRALCLDENATYVALMPGSRRQEIRYMAEPFLRAAAHALKQKPDLKFLTTHANEKRYQEFYDYFKQHAPHLPLEFFTHRTQDVIASSDFVLVTSGTATLEVMLHKKPMIITYRMARFIFPIVRFLVKSTYMGLPNLLANRLIVPELTQGNVNPERICNYMMDYLEYPEKRIMLEKMFLELHQSLRFNSSDRAADAILNMLGIEDEIKQDPIVLAVR